MSVDIEKSRAEAASARAEGEAAVITTTGAAEATRTQAHRRRPPRRPRRRSGLARAKGFDAQRRAIGAEQTALVAALREVGAGHVKIVPDIQVGGDGGVLGGVGALLMRNLASDANSRGGNGHGSGNGDGTVRRPTGATTERRSGRRAPGTAARA